MECTVGKRAPNSESAAHANPRRAVDRAIGQMAQRPTWSAQAIAALARNAASESVYLTAQRARLKSEVRFSSRSRAQLGQIRLQRYVTNNEVAARRFAFIKRGIISMRNQISRVPESDLC